MRITGRSGLALAGLVCGVLFTGCGASEPNMKSSVAGSSALTAHDVARPDVASNVEMAAKVAAPAETPASDDSPKLTLVALKDSQPDRYLIRNATISIETPDVHRVAQDLVAYTRTVHGYVSDSHESVDGLGTHTITIQLRVPASDFDSALERVEGQGKLQDKQVTTEDVTEEFVDSSARLRNLKSTELRLLDHLRQTGGMSDTLIVEKEIARVRQEIEHIEGRLKYLAHRIAYSTFSLTIHETPKLQTIQPTQTFSSGKVFSDATRSLVEFSQNLWAGAIWLGVWAMVWFPAIVLVRWLYLKQRDGKRQQNTNKTPV